MKTTLGKSCLVVVAIGTIVISSLVGCGGGHKEAREGHEGSVAKAAKGGNPNGPMRLEDCRPKVECALLNNRPTASRFTTLAECWVAATVNIICEASVKQVVVSIYTSGFPLDLVVFHRDLREGGQEVLFSTEAPITKTIFRPLFDPVVPLEIGWNERFVITADTRAAAENDRLIIYVNNVVSLVTLYRQAGKRLRVDEQGEVGFDQALAWFLVMPQPPSL